MNIKQFLRFYSTPKKTKFPPRPLHLIKEEEIQESFLKGGRGPGGQKINKTNSKVQLKHLPTGIVVTNQLTRSQEQNRKRARQLLAEKLEFLNNPQTSRLGVIQQRKIKAKQNKKKKTNRKYNKEADPKSDDELITVIDIEDDIDELFSRVKL